MVLIQNYREWSISNQVQILFITSSLVLCGVLVLITKVQLDWVRDQVIEDASSAFKSRLYTQLENIGQVQSSYFESEFSSYEDFTIHLASTDELLNGFNKNYSTKVFQTSVSHPHDSIVKSPEYSFGVYYSKFSTISSSGLELLKNESILNYIYPAVYTDYLLYYYQGYYTDQILNIYPGSTFSSVYSPLPREWFYRGAANKHNLTITEPYKDAGTGIWIMSMSRGILNDGRVFGVAACDVSLDTLVQKVKNIKILKEGFAVLVSATGIVLTVPDQWKVEGTKFIRLFDTEITRIPLEVWMQISSDSDSVWIDSNYKGSEELGLEKIHYLIYKKNIIPQYQIKVTHYLLIIIQKNELNDVKDNLKQNFASTYKIIFTIIYSISIVVFVLVVTLCCVLGRSLAKQFEDIGLTLGEVLRKAFFYRAFNAECFTWRNTQKYSGIESFKHALFDKVSEIENKESSFQNNHISSTRPDDLMIFEEWKLNFYPKYKNLDRGEIWDQHVNKSMLRVRDN